MSSVETRVADKAVICLLHNMDDNSWHPVVLIELVDKPKKGGVSRFATRSYRTEGFFVRENALKAISDDNLVPRIQEQGFSNVYIASKRDLYWSGIGPPARTVRCFRLKGTSPEPEELVAEPTDLIDKT